VAVRNGAEIEAKPDEDPAGSSPAVFSADELARELLGEKGAVLEKIHNARAIQASIAVSQMTGREVRVSFTESQLVALAAVAEISGGREIATRFSSKNQTPKITVDMCLSVIDSALAPLKSW
jgi:chemotaxis protein CheY-P-specific phosphatase CheC